MLLRPNKALDYTAQMNDTFYTEQTSEFYDKTNLYDLYRMEAVLNFKRTTDFRTMAECVTYLPMIGIRYNWQKAKLNSCFYNYKMEIVINLN